MEPNTDNPILSYRSAQVSARLPDTAYDTPRCQFCGSEMKHTTTIAPEGVALAVFECACNPGCLEFRLPKGAE